jgi:hypothetical protein
VAVPALSLASGIQLARWIVLTRKSMTMPSPSILKALFKYIEALGLYSVGVDLFPG